jgi:hypothetical protein
MELNAVKSKRLVLLQFLCEGDALPDHRSKGIRTLVHIPRTKRKTVFSRHTDSFQIKTVDDCPQWANDFDIHCMPRWAYRSIIFGRF